MRVEKLIAVIGSGDATPQEIKLAEAVGREIALNGAVLICGGMGGVMEAACRVPLRRRCHDRNIARRERLIGESFRNRFPSSHGFRPGPQRDRRKMSQGCDCHRG